MVLQGTQVSFEVSSLPVVLRWRGISVIILNVIAANDRNEMPGVRIWYNDHHSNGHACYPCIDIICEPCVICAI